METLAQLSVAVNGIAVQPPSPAWAVANIPDVEELQEVYSRDAASSWAGFMRYIDIKGQVSERRIVCRAVEGYGRAETIRAFCCERKASRSFRIDRIKELVCLQTGEVIDPVSHFEDLRLFGALKVIDKSLSDFGRALVFMSKCDGSVHPLEVDAVHSGMEKYVLRFGGDDRVLDQALKNIGKIAPDGEDLVNSLDRLSKHPESKQVARLVLSCMENVVAADGQLHVDELEWSELSRKHLEHMAG